MSDAKPFKFDRDAIFNPSAKQAPPAWPCALKTHCSRCDGAGYEVDQDGALAKATLCHCVKECPACLGQARRIVGNDSVTCRHPSPLTVVNHFNRAEIPARYAYAGLDHFKNDTGNGAEIVEKLKGWSQTFQPTGCKGAVICGPVGVGKTFIMASLARKFVDRGFSVRFTDFFQLLGDLRAGFSEGKADAAQLAPLINVDVLLIDEMGKGRGNDFEQTVLDQLICGRYNQNKTIIASTNYQLTGKKGGQGYQVPLDSSQSSASDFNPDQFGSLEDRIGTRMFSRMREMTHFIDMTGEDVRRLDA